MPISTQERAVFHYSAFGLQIASEVVCPGFAPGTAEPDVWIHRGEVPQYLLQPWAEEQFFEVDGNRLLLRIPEVACFLVESGREITVDAVPEADPDLWRVYLFGSAFGALLHQRGWFPLHGSALQGTRGAFVLTGPTGVGKSTLAAVLHARGLPVLSDDVCAVSLSGDSIPQLHPAYPRLHLCPDVLEKVEAPPGSLTPARKIIEKYGLDVQSSFAEGPAPLKSIFVLESGAVDQPHYEELSGMSKVLAIAENTYRPFYLQPMGQLEGHFRQVTAVAQSARVYRIRRPDDLSSLHPLADLVLELEARPTTPV